MDSPDSVKPIDKFKNLSPFESKYIFNNKNLPAEIGINWSAEGSSFITSSCLGSKRLKVYDQKIRQWCSTNFPLRLDGLQDCTN